MITIRINNKYLKTENIHEKTQNQKQKNHQEFNNMGVNFRNICQMKTYNQDASEHVKNIRIGTLNARSIKSKEELIMENLNEHKLDALHGYKIQMKMTPGFKQVNFAKMIMKYLMSTDKMREEEA